MSVIQDCVTVVGVNLVVVEDVANEEASGGGELVLA
jgi:hypothetical protein